MNFLGSYKKRLFIFLTVCFAVMSLTYIQALSALPGEITMIDGEEYVFEFRSPFLVSVRADQDGMLTANDGEIRTTGSFLNLSNPVAFKSHKRGSVNLNIKIFGFIPLKTMKVDIISNRQIVACGTTVGVKLKIDGILVIGMSDVELGDGKKSLPARDCGIKPGDLIVGVNSKKVDTIKDLTSEIERCKGGKIRLKYKHNGVYGFAEVDPVKAEDDNRYHIGLWVRENTAGIGTLTFFDAESRCFGALGHGITDIDTGTLMPIEKGEVLESNILAIKKSKVGDPGELKGVFVEDRNKLGVISSNCEYGIYGKLNPYAQDRISSRVYSFALRQQIKEGPAKILSNISGHKVEEYEILIQKVSKQNSNGTKGMVLKITDKRLLETTGGIVQGMSGSPIIQNDMIVGAVTHVLVNDPTRGYGIFIENMVKNILDSSGGSLLKAG